MVMAALMMIQSLAAVGLYDVCYFSQYAAMLYPDPSAKG